MNSSTAYRATTIELLAPDQLLIVWQDDHESLYSHFFLRCKCQCAGCRNEVTGKRILDAAKISAEIRASRWEHVGNYGIKILFSDGHSTGIYTFRLLRDACPCCQSHQQK